MFSVRRSFQKDLCVGNVCKGTWWLKKLDSLMVLTFEHLESCQSRGRLAQFLMFYACALDPGECAVKFAMELADMFICEVNPAITRMSAAAYLASYLSRAKSVSVAVVSILQRLGSWCYEYTMLHDVDMNPLAHQIFYSGCQAIMYMLCFRMKSLVDVPLLKLELGRMPLEPILKHRLNPLTMSFFDKQRLLFEVSDEDSGSESENEDAMMTP